MAVTVLCGVHLAGQHRCSYTCHPSVRLLTKWYFYLIQIPHSFLHINIFKEIASSCSFPFNLDLIQLIEKVKKKKVAKISLIPFREPPNMVHFLNH